MAQLLEEQRENWGTRGGFILAAVGSAVGLGNLWAFPYKLYSYAGGAFLIPYIIAMFAVGVPILILEFSLGHYTQRAAPNAFAKCGKKYEFVGWWGVVLGFAIITYYPVILAYCFHYLYFSVVGILNGGSLPWAGSGAEGIRQAHDFFFKTYLNYHEGFSLGEVRWEILVTLFVSWLTMYFCIFKGVKLVGKIVWLTVPLPWLMLLILTVRGLTLEGSVEGLVYYLEPNWHELAKPTTWRFAFGQVFYSMSIAFGVMVTYASFLHRKSDINNNAAIIGLSDFATSFIAGLAIFATMGGMAFLTKASGNPVPVEEVAKSGPSLAFIAFPYALAQLPYSAWFSFIFFFALVTLGVDSAFSITETVLTSIVDKTGWKRSIVLPLMSVVGLVFGVVYVTQGGLNWLGAIDGFINGTWGIALLGLLECAVLGWLYNVDDLRRHANSRSDWKLGKSWNVAIKVVVPILLGTLFFWSMYDDFNSPSGFIFNKDGGVIIQNCVGLGVMVLSPVLAILMSCVKSRIIDGDEFCDYERKIMGREFGMPIFWLSMLLLFVSILQVLVDLPIFSKRFSGVIVIFLSGVILAASHYMTEKFNTKISKPSKLIGLSGIIATLALSGSLASILIKFSNSISVTNEAVKRAEHLGLVSYVILAVVFVIIVGGLGWCFYRAVLSASADESQQLTGEID